PDMLLLDEPTNHLDAESVAWLERFLQEYPGTVVAVTHDRYFLDNVAGWILELDRGHGIPWQGNYSSWLGQKQARLAAAGEGEAGGPGDAGGGAGGGGGGPAGAPGEEQGPPLRLRDPAGGRGRAPGRRRRDRHPARPAPGRHRGGGRAPRQGLRRPDPHRRPHVQPAPGRHRRRDRPQRRGQDDALPDDRRGGEA